jgi:hypothetical protein
MDIFTRLRDLADQIERFSAEGTLTPLRLARHVRELHRIAAEVSPLEAFHAEVLAEVAEEEAMQESRDTIERGRVLHEAIATGQVALLIPRRTPRAGDCFPAA